MDLPGSFPVYIFEIFVVSYATSYLGFLHIAILGTMFSEIFSIERPYAGISLGDSISAAASGTAPLVATALLAKFNKAYIPATLSIFTAVIFLIAICIKVKNLDAYNF